LEPLVKKCLPILIPRREEDLKEELDEGTILNFNNLTTKIDIVQKGTVLAVDKTTYQVEVLGVTKKSGTVSEKENSIKHTEEEVAGIIDQLINYLTSQGTKMLRVL
jgi:hypothetical protein